MTITPLNMRIFLACACIFFLSGQTFAATLVDAKRADKDGDYIKAARLYKNLAEQGNASAQLRLAEMYEDGTGVIQDYQEVANWARRAAEQGNEDGQLLLATLYQHGEGVQTNFVKAYMWSNIAAVHANSLGLHSPAIVKRDNLAKFMSGAQVTEAQEQAKKCTANKLKGC